MFEKDFYNLRAVGIVIDDQNPSFLLWLQSQRRVPVEANHRQRPAEENLLPSIFASSINAHWLRNVTR